MPSALLPYLLAWSGLALLWFRGNLLKAVGYALILGCSAASTGDFVMGWSPYGVISRAYAPPVAARLALAALFVVFWFIPQWHAYKATRSSAPAITHLTLLVAPTILFLIVLGIGGMFL